MSSTTVIRDPSAAVDRGHLQPDDPAADDEQTLRNFGERQGSRGIHQPGVARGKAGEFDGARAHRDDACVEGNGGFSVIAGNGDLVRRAEAPVTAQHRDVALRGQAVEASGESRNHLPHVSAKPVEIDLRRSECHPVCLGRGGIVDHFGHVEQRLGRDASDIEAHAPEHTVALDQRHALAEIGAAKGGGVATGPAAEDDDVEVPVRHCRGAATNRPGLRGGWRPRTARRAGGLFIDTRNSFRRHLRGFRLHLEDDASL